MDETVQGGRVAGDGAPDRATQALIVLVAVLASLALLLLHQGQEWHWPWLSDSRVLFAGYTLATAPPLMLALMISRIDERRTWVVIGLTAMLLLGLSLHNGTACFPPGTGCGPVRATYIPSLVVALFILLPFLQAVRDRQPGDAWQPPYPLLFRYAWDNALALAGTALFIGVSWLILWLWAALFVLLGITVFRDLFDKLRFIYPANGLMTGFGLVLCRAQGGALRALLRLCLSLCRALLPFIAVLALSFLAVVLLQGVEPLWKTGRAASLLLWLVLGTLVLTNGVFQDGEADDPYPRWLRHVVGAGLLTMPVHAGPCRSCDLCHCTAREPARLDGRSADRSTGCSHSAAARRAAGDCRVARPRRLAGATANGESAAGRVRGGDRFGHAISAAGFPRHHHPFAVGAAGARRDTCSGVRCPNLCPSTGTGRASGLEVAESRSGTCRECRLHGED